MIYFDNAASTRMDDRVLEAMLPYLKESFGNANGKYSLGYEARKAVNEARKTIASAISAEPDEIYFTSGGTEGNNTVLSSAKVIVSSETEHDSVLKVIENAKENATKTVLLKPDSFGMVTPKILKEKLEELDIKGDPSDFKKRVLVSIMLVNNETGNIQNIKELAKVAHSYGCVFHTDAVQAAGHMRINVKELGVDALTASGHKLYGPKGTGFVFIRRGVSLNPLIYGGGQERGMRSGTENVPGIVGLGKACELAALENEINSRKEREIAEYFKKTLLETIPETKINGDGKWVLNFSFAGINGTSLALRLDMEGICVSTGSACSSGLDERSHVLTAMGLSNEQADSSIRISIGKYNTMEEAEFTCFHIKRLVEELRSLGR